MQNFIAVMNVFEHKPVNQAHLFERKAKKSMEKNDLENGIKFYQHASSYMAKAMEAKYSVNCYSILRSQYDKYGRLILQCQKLLEQEKVLAETPLVCEEEVPVQASPEPSEPEAKLQINVSQNFQITQREPDSLLQFLNESSSKAYSAIKLKKLPKANREIIEELSTQIMNLRLHVESLLEKNEKLEHENSTLHSKVHSLELEVENLSNQLNSKANECASLPHDIVPQSFLFDNSHFDYSSKPSCHK